MKQDKISEVTRKAIERPLELTNLIMEKTEKVRNPSPKVNKIGRTIGVGMSAILIIAGGVQLVIGRPYWAIGTLSTGMVTFISNVVVQNKKKK